MQVSSFPMFIFVTRALVSGLWALARNGHPKFRVFRVFRGQGLQKVVCLTVRSCGALGFGFFDC